MKELSTQIEIHASPENVWRILTDFPNYPNWNPFFIRVVGKPGVGEPVDLTLPGGASRCTITQLEPNRVLTWTYHVLHPSLFHGEHSMGIQRIEPNRVHFLHGEVFSGLLVPLLAKRIDTTIRRGFEEMNKALKQQAEQAA